MHSRSDQQRVEALHHYDLLDTPRESTFDLITTMVAEILQVPHACVSLVDRDRVWFKAATNVDSVEVKREPGFCSTLVSNEEDIRHIEDAVHHPETSSNSLVCGEPGIRFYAGAPLTSPKGHRIGTLCAFGPAPRGLNQAERATLRSLSTLVMNEIELRRTRQQLARTEAALQKAQKLESVGLVASGVAHDFNNLLGGMLGHAELLREELQNNPAGLELLDEIETTGRRATDLVGQVLAYAGRGTDSPIVPTDLNALIYETHHMLETSLETRAQICLHLAENLPAVPGQSTGLRQLVMNLLTNASEACQGTNGRVWLTTEAHANQVILTVTDNGHGLEEEAQAQIFEPFTSSKAGGRGLGLAICHRIVEEHAGSIEIESEVGRGTTFRVLLPACKESAAALAQEQEEARTVMGQGLILVVDDEPIIRELAHRSLERAGFQVLLAKGGAEAIELLDRDGREVSVVVLDWSMPRVDGEQVLAAMHERRLNLPVVLSSGHSEADAEEKTSKYSIASFLKKPYRVNDLVRKVQEAQGQQAAPAVQSYVSP